MTPRERDDLWLAMSFFVVGLVLVLVGGAFDHGFVVLAGCAIFGYSAIPAWRLRDSDLFDEDHPINQGPANE